MWIRRRAQQESRHTGADAERQAQAYLEQQGLKLEQCNYRCKVGEIDLLMWENSTLVFVEVRSRKHLQFGSPAETVNHHKQAKLLRAAEHYLQSKRLSDKVPCRFDVVSIARKPDASADIDWIQNAF